MTNPTSNYSFQMPTATDLVTDLPADFEVFGQAVDTRLKALQPGTTLGDLAYSSATANTNTRLGVGTNGQVLAVVAGVPAWQNGTTGDIEGVTAGVGISGGGTSGTVTVTNSMATAITTNGDLIYGTGSGTFARLGIGTTGQVLNVAAGIPAWATASAPAFNGARVTGASQLIPAGVKTAVAWNTETFDTNSYHDNATNNSRMTVPSTGKYLVTTNITWDYGDGGYRRVGFMVNGTTDFSINQTLTSAVTDAVGVTTTAILSLTAADYVQVMATQTRSAGTDLYLVGGATQSSFQIQYLGA